MSIEETTETKTRKAPRKRKPARKPRPAANAAPRKPGEGIYAGLTVKDCCSACNADGCVISGKSYCGHPRKGGLHAAEQQDSAALNRRREAEKVLGKQKLRVEE